MSQQTQHKIFAITEIVELILLHTEIQTLLTSSQRVCRHWQHIIENCYEIQVALFLRPSKEKPRRGTKRTKNPLLEEIFWQKLLSEQQGRKGKHLPASIERIKSVLDFINHRKKPLLRPEASWRRMLLQQPPTSTLAIVEHDTLDLVPWYSEIAVRPSHNRGFLRMGQVYEGIKRGVLIPDKVPFLVRFEPCRPKRPEGEKGGMRSRAVSQYLTDCDLVVFSDPTLRMLRERRSDPKDRFEAWYRRVFGDSYWAVVDRTFMRVV